MDLGCGSGRDTKHFLEKGYEVVAIDASLEMKKLAEAYTMHPILHKTFDAINYEQEFDGIWAIASLVHVRQSNNFSVNSENF